MFKLIPISAVLLLTIGSAQAQNNTDSDGYSSSLPNTTPATPTTDTTDSTLNGTATTTSSPSNTNGTSGIDTSGTTNISTDPTLTTTPVSTTPGTTTTSPTTITTPSTTPSATSSSTTTTTTTTTLSPVTSFTCAGNSPAWNLSISKDLITYSTGKDGNVKLRSVTSMTPTGDSSGSLQVFAAKGANGKPVTILVKKNDAGCTGGLPGQTYQYDTFIVFSNMVVTGCCNPL